MSMQRNLSWSWSVVFYLVAAVCSPKDAAPASPTKSPCPGKLTRCHSSLRRQRPPNSLSLCFPHSSLCPSPHISPRRGLAITLVTRTSSHPLGVFRCSAALLACWSCSKCVVEVLLLLVLLLLALHLSHVPSKQASKQARVVGNAKRQGQRRERSWWWWPWPIL